MNRNSPDRPAPVRILRLGTRASPLARVQADIAAEALRHAAKQADVHLDIAIVPLTTGGDREQVRPLAEIGGKALWTRAIDRALIEERIDIAVHSLKDVETSRPPAIVLGAVLPRADARDRLIARSDIAATRVADLPQAAQVGTSSPRRAAQLRALRPDLAIVGLRGNIATRLARLAEGQCDATLLAAAGLDRLRLAEVGHPQPLADWLPAAAQGAIGLECRRADALSIELLARANHRASAAAVAIERCLLAALGGDCHTPIAAYCEPIEADTGGAETAYRLRAEIYASNGQAKIADQITIATQANRLEKDSEGEKNYVTQESGCVENILREENITAVADFAKSMLDRAPASIRQLFASQSTQQNTQRNTQRSGD